MKKVLSIILALVLVLTLVACGGKSGTVQDYLNRPDVKKQLDTARTQIESMGMKLDIKGEDNKLIYAYTYGTQIDDAEAAKAALEQAIKSEDATFKATAQELKKVGKVNDPVVVIKYLNADGSEIFSKEYMAD